MTTMNSVYSVHPGPDVSAFGESHRARVRVVTRDPFGTFARIAGRQRSRRLTIVSPWISVGGPRFMTLGRLVARAECHGVSLVMVTRPPQSHAHEEAIELVHQSSRGVVHFVPGLHAKFTCARRGTAVVSRSSVQRTPPTRPPVLSRSHWSSDQNAVVPLSLSSLGRRSGAPNGLIPPIGGQSNDPQGPFRTQEGKFQYRSPRGCGAYFGGSMMHEQLRERLETTSCVSGRSRSSASSLRTVEARRTRSITLSTCFVPSSRRSTRRSRLHLTSHRSAPRSGGAKCTATSSTRSALIHPRSRDGALGRSCCARDPVAHLQAKGVLKYGEQAIIASQARVFRALLFGGPMEGAALQWLKGGRSRQPRRRRSRSRRRSPRSPISSRACSTSLRCSRLASVEARPAYRRSRGAALGHEPRFGERVQGSIAQARQTTRTTYSV